MDKIGWIRELVHAEQQMEETGMVDFGNEMDPERSLVAETLDFLGALKETFVDALNAFNELKSAPVGRIKIYGIAKTHADFMLFRNGFKLIFSLKQPGIVTIRFNFMNAGMTPQPGTSALIYSGAAVQSLMDDDIIEARWGAFGEVTWTYRGQPVRIDNIVRYYLTRFVKDSAK